MDNEIMLFSSPTGGNTLVFMYRINTCTGPVTLLTTEPSPIQQYNQHEQLSEVNNANDLTLSGTACCGMTRHEKAIVDASLVKYPSSDAP